MNHLFLSWGQICSGYNEQVVTQVNVSLVIVSSTLRHKIVFLLFESQAQNNTRTITWFFTLPIFCILKKSDECY